MFLGIIFFIVHAKYNGDVFILGRRGNDDLLRTARFNMRFRFCGIRKEAGRLNHNVNTHFPPLNGAGVLFSGHFYGPAVHHKVAIFHFNLVVELTIGGIIFQQMGVCRGFEQVIYGHYFKIVWVALFDRTKHQAADAAKAIDTNFY